MTDPRGIQRGFETDAVVISNGQLFLSRGLECVAVFAAGMWMSCELDQHEIQRRAQIRAQEFMQARTSGATP